MQATLAGLNGVASTAEQRELSDSLGVSSALYLGANDMLKLKAMLEEPDAPAQVLRVLRRLSMVPMTIQLNNSTDMLEFMVLLSTDDTVQAAVQAGVERGSRGGCTGSACRECVGGAAGGRAKAAGSQCEACGASES